MSFSGFRSFLRIGRSLAVLAVLTLRLTAASPSSNPWILDGEQHEAGLGNTVTGVGDVNRDGYEDLLIAAPLHDGQRGRVFVFHGSQAGLHQRPDWDRRGLVTGDQLGYGAAAAGDVNGDGYADVLVASLGHRPGQLERNVTVWLFAGSPSGLRTNALWSIHDAEDCYGCTVGTAGDVNKDGYADVFVSWLHPPGTSSPHRGLLLFHGSPTGPASSPDWRAEGMALGVSKSFGSSASAAGDVNGDGFGDLLVGARDARGTYPQGGKVFLFTGSSNGLSSLPAWTATFDLPRRTLQDPEGVMFFGSFLAGVGDVNGDHFADVVVAAPYADHHDTDEGIVFVYHGSASGLSPVPNQVIEANRPMAVLGYPVAAVGDLDGDGYADVALGAPWATFQQNNQGAVAVFRGGRDGLQPDPDWSWWGEASQARLGMALAGTGDVNGDGFPEVVATAPGHRSAAGTVGRVLVWYGGQGTAQGSQSWRMTKPWGTRLVEGFQDVAPPWQWTVSLAAVVAVGIGAYATGRLFERHRQGVIQRERAAAQLRERERLARDLHDGMGSHISRLARLIPRLGDPDRERAASQEDIARTARELALALEQTIWSLEPEQDTLENLVVYLGQYADQFLEGSGLRCRRDLPVELPGWRLSADVRQHLFLAVKEALNNVAKHAGAAEVWLRVRWQTPHLTLIIEDDGVGLPAGADIPKGNGLANMQHRLAQLGGHARVERGPERGTRVILQVPVADPEGPRPRNPAR